MYRLHYVHVPNLYNLLIENTYGAQATLKKNNSYCISAVISMASNPAIHAFHSKSPKPLNRPRHKVT